MCSSLRLIFPRAKLRRQILRTWVEVWAKNLAKSYAKLLTNISGHFRASFAVQNDRPKFLPKLRPIYHSMSCDNSCGWDLKISSPRASGAWGAQQLVRGRCWVSGWHVSPKSVCRLQDCLLSCFGQYHGHHKHYRREKSQRIISGNLVPDNYREKLRTKKKVVTHFCFLSVIPALGKGRTIDYLAEILWEFMW